jgi:hypothetical protein
MSASSVTGTGPGSSKTRTVYASQLLPPNSILITSGPGADSFKGVTEGESGQLKIDSLDSSDYLGNKLVAGNYISLATSVGPDKNITISTSASSIGIEQISTSNGSPITGPFTNVGGQFIWNSFLTSVPKYLTATNIWSPYGTGTSHITIIPAPDAVTSDQFVCSKNIRNLRFYTIFQTSVATTGRWRTNLVVNGTIVSGLNWGAPPNNVINMRTFGVLEWGGIAAGSTIYTTIDASTLPASCQNSNSYFVIEYDL